MKTINPYTRSAKAGIMRRAHEIARERRAAAAQEAYDIHVRIVGSRIIHTRPLSDFLAETPVDFSAALKTAWAEAKAAEAEADTSTHGALIVVQRGSLAPLRRFRHARVWPLLLTVARFLSNNFIRSRAA